MQVGNFQTAAPMKGRLHPRLRATRSSVGKRGIQKYTPRGTGGRGGTFKSRVFDKSVGGSKRPQRMVSADFEEDTTD